MARHQLSGGSLLKICAGAQNVGQPIFQLLQTKKIAATSSERYRMLISDGVNSNSYGMLATQLNGYIHEEKLQEFCIFKVKNFQCNNMQGKRVIIILDLEILQAGPEVGSKIGSPIAIAADGTVPTQTSEANGSSDQNRAPNSNIVDNKRFAQNQAAGTPPTKKQNFMERPSAPSTPSGGTQRAVYPIASLTPYQNKWCIKARVTNKSDIRRWSNSRGEGHLFSMDLVDESGEIRATAFKAECDKFEPIAEIDKVYYISNCKLKPANKQYTTINNDYELTFSELSEMVPCQDADTDKIPRVTFSFVQLDQLSASNKDEVVDVIGICRSAKDVATITSKAGKELTKRDITIADQSLAEIGLTLWGGIAESFNPANNPVIAIKGCKVSDWNGVSLSTGFSCIFQTNPDIPKCHSLKGWYDNEGYKETFKSMSEGMSGNMSTSTSNPITIGVAKFSQLGVDSVKGEYYSTIASIVMFQKDRAVYQACSQTNPEGKNCQKKVQDQGNGTYRCEKCNMDMDSFNYRIILSFSIADATDNQWVQCFNDQAVSILGVSAQELGLMQTNDPEGFNRVFQQASYKKFNFRLRAKLESYNDENKIRYSVMSADNVDLETYNQFMMKELSESGIDVPKVEY